MGGLLPTSRTPSAACWAIWRLVASSRWRSLDVFQGHRGVGGQLGQGLFIGLAERAAQAVDDLEGPEQLARLAPQRHAEQRSRAVAELGVDLVVDGLRLDRGIHAAGLAGAEYLAHHAPVVGNPQLALLDAQRRPAHQAVVGPVPQEDAGPVGLEQAGSGLGHLHEQGLDLAGLVPLAGDVEDGFQLADASGLPAGGACGGQGLAHQRPQRLDQRQRRGRIRRSGPVQQQRLDRRGPQRQGDGRPGALRAAGLAIEHVGQQFDGQ